MASRQATITSAAIFSPFTFVHFFKSSFLPSQGYFVFLFVLSQGLSPRSALLSFRLYLKSIWQFSVIPYFNHWLFNLYLIVPIFSTISDLLHHYYPFYTLAPFFIFAAYYFCLNLKTNDQTWNIYLKILGVQEYTGNSFVRVKFVNGRMPSNRLLTIGMKIIHCETSLKLSIYTMTNMKIQWYLDQQPKIRWNYLLTYFFNHISFLISYFFSFFSSCYAFLYLIYLFNRLSVCLLNQRSLSTLCVHLRVYMFLLPVRLEKLDNRSLQKRCLVVQVLASAVTFSDDGTRH